MATASKIRLVDAGWNADHEAAFRAMRDALLQTIHTTYRDRRKRACIFTDASNTGWAYAITQCDPGELLKPWAEQHHELLAVNSGKFRYSQQRWNMSCKEAFPIRHAVERHRHLLAGDLPFASVNDHKSLVYILDGPAKDCTVSVAARDRLKRWAEYLRSFTFETIHIPGEANHFCDLLSRNGCARTVSTWASVKHGDGTQTERVAANLGGAGDARGKPVCQPYVSASPPCTPVPAPCEPLPQMAILTPTTMAGGGGRGHKDLDIQGDDLMPTIPSDQ